MNENKHENLSMTLVLVGACAIGEVAVTRFDLDALIVTLFVLGGAVYHAADVLGRNAYIALLSIAICMK